MLGNTLPVQNGLVGKQMISTKQRQIDDTQRYFFAVQVALNAMKRSEFWLFSPDQGYPHPRKMNCKKTGQSCSLVPSVKSLPLNIHTTLILFTFLRYGHRHRKCHWKLKVTGYSCPPPAPIKLLHAFAKEDVIFWKHAYGIPSTRSTSAEYTLKQSV